MATRILITGRVQGVGYRQWMCRQADRLGLTGWVRNLRDGSVESVVEGDPAAVQKLVEYARSGPPASRVTAVVTEEASPGNFSAFDWRPTP
jgi:acylphosphatase